MNERIPKIKKKIKNNLQSVDVNNRDVQNLLREVNKTCLDTDFRNAWEAVGIYMIHNSELEDNYIKKRAELKDEGRTAASLQDQLGFLVARPSSKNSIVNTGLKATRQYHNRLGNGECGVYINRYFDIELKSCWKSGDVSKEIFVFKYFFGKRKAITLVNLSATEASLDPTPNYDCHTSSVHPRKEDNPFRQSALSSVYLYEYTDACEPALYPRQCLPTAIIECKKRVTIPIPNPQILSKAESQPGPTKNGPLLPLPKSASSPVINRENNLVNLLKAENQPGPTKSGPLLPLPKSASSTVINRENNLGAAAQDSSPSVSATFLSPPPHPPSCQKLTRSNSDVNQNVITIVGHQTKSLHSTQPSDSLPMPHVITVTNSSGSLPNEKNVVRRIDKRSAGSMDSFLQQTPQYLERLNEACAKLQNEKIKNTNVLDSLLPNSSVNPIAQNESYLPQQPLGNSKDIRDPRLIKTTTKASEKNVFSAVEKPSSYNSTTSQRPKKSNETKKMSYSEYIKLKTMEKDKKDTKDSPDKKQNGPSAFEGVESQAISNKAQVSLNNIGVTNHTIGSTTDYLSRFQSPHIRTESNSKFYSQFQSPIPPQHSAPQNLFQSLLASNSASPELPVDKNNTIPSNPSSSLAKSRPKSEKKAFLPFPVLCEDGSVRNVYRGTIDGSVREMPTTSSDVQVRNDADRTKNSVGDSDTSSPSVKEGANTLFKAFQNVFADGKKKKLLERQLSNGKKEDLVDADQNMIKEQSFRKGKSEILKHTNERTSTEVKDSCHKDQHGKENMADDVISHGQDNEPSSSNNVKTATVIKNKHYSKGKQNEKSLSRDERISLEKCNTNSVTNKSNMEKSSATSKRDSKSNSEKRKDSSKGASRTKTENKTDRKGEVRKDEGNQVASEVIKRKTSCSSKESGKYESKQVTKSGNGKHVVQTDVKSKRSSKVDKSSKKHGLYIENNKPPTDRERDVVCDKVTSNENSEKSKEREPNIVHHLMDDLEVETTNSVSSNDQNFSCHTEEESISNDDDLSDDDVTQPSLLLRDDFNGCPRFVCRSPNADIPGINFSLDLSGDTASSKSYCSPLRLIPSLCSEVDPCDQVNFSEAILESTLTATSSKVKSHDCPDLEQKSQSVIFHEDAPKVSKPVEKSSLSGEDNNSKGQKRDTIIANPENFLEVPGVSISPVKTPSDHDLEEKPLYARVLEQPLLLYTHGEKRPSVNNSLVNDFEEEPKGVSKLVESLDTLSESEGCQSPNHSENILGSVKLSAGIPQLVSSVAKKLSNFTSSLPVSGQFDITECPNQHDPSKVSASDNSKSHTLLGTVDVKNCDLAKTKKPTESSSTSTYHNDVPRSPLSSSSSYCLLIDESRECESSLSATDQNAKAMEIHQEKPNVSVSLSFSELNIEQGKSSTSTSASIEDLSGVSEKPSTLVSVVELGSIEDDDELRDTLLDGLLNSSESMNTMKSNLGMLQQSASDKTNCPTKDNKLPLKSDISQLIGQERDSEVGSDIEEKRDLHPLPQSLSLEELGFNFYLQALSDMSYQPSVIVLDFKEAIQKGLHHSTCAKCCKELTCDVVAACFDDSEIDDTIEDNEQTIVQDSESAVSDKSSRPTNLHKEGLSDNLTTDSQVLPPSLMANDRLMGNEHSAESGNNVNQIEKENVYRMNDSVLPNDFSRNILPPNFRCTERQRSVNESSVNKNEEKCKTKRKIHSSPVKDSLESYYNYKSRLMKRQRERNQLQKIKEKLSTKGIVGPLKKKLDNENKVNSSVIEDDDELRDTLLDGLLTSSSESINEVQPKVKTLHENRSDKTFSPTKDTDWPCKSGFKQVEKSSVNNAKTHPLDLYDMLENDLPELNTSKLVVKQTECKMLNVGMIPRSAQKMVSKPDNKLIDIGMVPRSAQKFLKKKEIISSNKEIHTVPLRNSDTDHSRGSSSSETKRNVGVSISENVVKSVEIKKDDKMMGQTCQSIRQLKDQNAFSKWKPVKDAESTSESAKPSRLVVEKGNVIDSEKLLCSDFKEINSKDPSTAQAVEDPDSALNSISKEADTACHNEAVEIPKVNNKWKPVPESDKSSGLNNEVSHDIGKPAKVVTEMPLGEEEISKASVGLEDPNPKCVGNYSQSSVKNQSPDLSLYLDQPLGDVDYRAGFHFRCPNRSLPSTLMLPHFNSSLETVDCNGDVDYRTHVAPMSLPTSGQTIEGPIDKELSASQENCENEIGHDRKLLIWPTFEPSASNFNPNDLPDPNQATDNIPISAMENPDNLPLEIGTSSQTNFSSTQSVTPVSSSCLLTDQKITPGNVLDKKVTEEVNVKKETNGEYAEICTNFKSASDLPLENKGLSESFENSQKSLVKKETSVPPVSEQSINQNDIKIECNRSVIKCETSPEDKKKHSWLEPKDECGDSVGDNTFQNIKNETILPSPLLKICSTAIKNINAANDPPELISDKKQGNAPECGDEDANNAVENIRKCFPDILGTPKTISEIPNAYSDDEDSDEETCSAYRKKDRLIPKIDSVEEELLETTKINLSQDHVSMLKRAVDTVSKCMPSGNLSSPLLINKDPYRVDFEPQRINLSHDHISMLEKAINTVSKIVPANTSTEKNLKKEILETTKVNLSDDQLSMLKRAMTRFSDSMPTIKAEIEKDDPSGSVPFQSTDRIDCGYPTKLKKEYSSNASGVNKSVDDLNPVEQGEAGEKSSKNVGSRNLLDKGQERATATPSFPSKEALKARLSNSSSEILDALVDHISETIVANLSAKRKNRTPVEKRNDCKERPSARTLHEDSRTFRDRSPCTEKDVKTNKAVASSEIETDDSNENKVLLSDVPLEALTKAKLHVLEQLESLNEDDDGELEDVNDKTITNEDEELLTENERNVVMSDRTIESGEISSASDGDDSVKSCGSVKGVNMSYTDFFKSKLEVVNISSDSDAGELHVPRKKKRINRNIKPARQTVNKLHHSTAKLLSEDFIEIISSPSDRSSVSSPVIVRDIKTPTEDVLERRRVSCERNSPVVSNTNEMKSLSRSFSTDSPKVKFSDLKICLDNRSKDGNQNRQYDQRRVVVTSHTEDKPLKDMDKIANSLSDMLKEARKSSQSKSDEVENPDGDKVVLKDKRSRDMYCDTIPDSENSDKFQSNRDWSPVSDIDDNGIENPLHGTKQYSSDIRLVAGKQGRSFAMKSLRDKSLEPRQSEWTDREEQPENYQSTHNDRCPGSSPEVWKGKRPLDCRLNTSPPVRKSRRMTENENSPNSRYYRNASPDGKDRRKGVTCQEKHRKSPDTSRNSRKEEKDEWLVIDKYYSDLSPDAPSDRERDRLPSNDSDRYRNASPEFPVNEVTHARSRILSNNTNSSLSPRYEIIDDWKDEKHDEYGSSTSRPENRARDTHSCVSNSRGKSIENVQSSSLNSPTSESFRFGKGDDRTFSNKRRRVVSVEEEDLTTPRVTLSHQDSSFESKGTFVDRQDYTKGKHKNSKVNRESDSSYSGIGSDCVNSSDESSNFVNAEYSRHRYRESPHGEDTFQFRNRSPHERSFNPKGHQKSSQVSDLVSHFSSEDDRSNYRSNRNYFKRKRNEASFEYSRTTSGARQHPLDELMEPLQKRRAPNGEDELDYYLNRKKTYYGYNRYNNNYRRH